MVIWAQTPRKLEFSIFFTFTFTDSLIRFQRALNHYQEIILKVPPHVGARHLPKGLDASRNVEKSREMSRNVEKCRVLRILKSEKCIIGSSDIKKTFREWMEMNIMSILKHVFKEFNHFFHLLREIRFQDFSRNGHLRSVKFCHFSSKYQEISWNFVKR